MRSENEERNPASVPAGVGCGLGGSGVWGFGVRVQGLGFEVGAWGVKVREGVP